MTETNPQKAEIYRTMDGRYGFELIPHGKRKQGFNTEKEAADASRIALGHKKHQKNPKMISADFKDDDLAGMVYFYED